MEFTKSDILNERSNHLNATMAVIICYGGMMEKKC